MILYSGLDSIIESLYLDDEMTESIKDSSIIINPEVNLCPYLYSKLVIITHMNYDLKLLKLLRTNNRVISRINSNIKGILFRPYILRINDRIQRSGSTIESVNEETYSSVDYLFDGSTLYYPSPLYYSDCIVMNNYLTSLGYLLYQIGYDFIDNNVFRNLDVIKLRNGLIIDHN